MLTKVAVAISVCCLVLPATTFAQGFAQGDKEVLLNAAGVSENDFDSNVFSLEGSFGYFFTKNIEGADPAVFQHLFRGRPRQQLECQHPRRLDYHLDMGRFWPFFGGSIGYTYGDDVTDTWTAGLEGGLKYFVNPTTFILGRIEYDWLLDSDDSGFSDATWVYVIGIGFKW